jgi:DNA-binding FadR family transcriptional regulator
MGLFRYSELVRPLGQFAYTLYLYMPLQTIEPQRLYRVIADQMRNLIATGEFAVGTRLPAERDLSKQLGVSRPSVREALIALEVEGAIEVRTGSGIYVRNKKPNPKARANKLALTVSVAWGPLELMRARELVESEVAAQAARNAKRADINTMRDALEQMHAAATAGKNPRAGDEAFHLAVAQACGNAVLHDTVRQYWQAQQNPLFTRMSDYFDNPRSWKAAWAEHALLLDAISRHDVQAARDAMQLHLKKAFTRYSASWRRAQAA